MVFTSVVNLVRSRGPDQFWRNRKIFKLSAVLFLKLFIKFDGKLKIYSFSTLLEEGGIVTRLHFA